MNPGLAAVVLIIGCMLSALTGPGAAQNQSATSTFAGVYTGPYTTKSLKKGYPDDKGKYTISITGSGKITGSTRSALTRDATALAGSVDQDGLVLLTVKYASATFGMKGTVSKTRTGHIKGTLLQYSGREVVASDEIDLGPK